MVSDQFQSKKLFFCFWTLWHRFFWKASWIVEKNPQLENLPRGFHRKFQIGLAKGLIKKTSRKRPPEPEVESSASKIRKYCHLCPYRESRTNNLCQKCQKITCQKHLVKVCGNCLCVGGNWGLVFRGTLTSSCDAPQTTNHKFTNFGFQK